MNLFAISGILIALTSSIMAFLMFFRGRQWLHYLWGAFCVSVAVWGLGATLVGVSTDPAWADIWWRMAHIGIIFIPALFLHFTYVFLGEGRKWVVYASYILGLCFLVTNFIGTLFIADVRWVFDQFYYDVPGILYIPFTIYFFGLVVYSHWLLIRAHTVSQGLRKTQIRYFLIATIVGFAGGAFSFLPVYKVDIYPALNVSVALYPIIIGYTILRHRLMDIRIVARKVFIAFGVATFSYGIFFFLVWLYETLFGGVFTASTYIAGLFAAPLFCIIFYVLDKQLKAFSNKYLFTSLFNYQDTITKLTDELNYEMKLDRIVDLIMGAIEKTMEVDRLGVILASNRDVPHSYYTAKVLGFDSKNMADLARYTDLFSYLQMHQKPLVRDEISYLIQHTSTQDRSLLSSIQDMLDRMDIVICLPLASSNNILGVIVLGTKQSGSAYSKEDLELLNTLSKSAGIAVENALLYKESQAFGERLTQEVDLATRDLQKANQHLKDLMKMRTEFLQIASHQLRTPVSVMRGTLDMLREDKGTFTPEQRDQLIERAYVKSKKLTNVIFDILSATEMDVPDFDVDSLAKEIDLVSIARDATDSFIDDAKEKGVELVFESDFSAVRVKGSDMYIPQAITNLIDNAIKYTKEGSVTVRVYEEDDKAVCVVEDTGIGISKDDMDKLWSKFSRAKNAKDMYTDGSGLGLFIVKKIIEGHAGGEVFMESNVGKGSTFGFKLPMIQSDGA